MDASLETLVIAAYVFACSLSIPRPGPRGKVSDHELIALAVAQAATGLVSDRQFLATIGRLLPGCFPQLPGRSVAAESPLAADPGAEGGTAAFGGLKPGRPPRAGRPV